MLKKDLIKVVTDVSENDVKKYIEKVNQILPLDAPESLTILKLLKESLLEEDITDEIKKCIKNVN